MNRAGAERLLFVHAGTHKTGTTSLQRLLRERADMFAGHGCLVPEAGWPRRYPGHNNIAWELFGDGRFDPALGTVADLAAELGQSPLPRAVISAEELQALVDRPELRRSFEARMAAAGWQTVWVVYFRRTVDYALSLLGAMERRGRSHPDLGAFIRGIADGEGIRNADGRLYLFDREVFARRWTAGGGGPLVIRDRDRAHAGPGLVADFLAVLGLPPGLGDSAAVANVSPPNARRRWRKLRLRAALALRPRCWRLLAPGSRAHGPGTPPGPLPAPAAGQDGPETDIDSRRVAG